MKRTPIRRMSLRRQQTYPKYRKLAKEYLAAHPHCEHWLAERGLKESDVEAYPFFHPVFSGVAHWVDANGWQHHDSVPRSTEIHHRRGRGKYYLDVSTFMACRPGHAIYIHQHLSDSRKKGYIIDR